LLLRGRGGSLQPLLERLSCQFMQQRGNLWRSIAGGVFLRHAWKRRNPVEGLERPRAKDTSRVRDAPGSRGPSKSTTVRGAGSQRAATLLATHQAFADEKITELSPRRCLDETSGSPTPGQLGN